MAWEKFIRTRLASNDEPMATLSKSHIYFNTIAARLAELDKAKRVAYLIDEENRKIGFEFQRDDGDPASYAIFSKKGSSGYRSSVNDLSARYPWVRAVAVLKDSSMRKFALVRDGKLWSIQLCPAFENRAPRSDVSKIPGAAKGIYRYLRKDGEIVYIGKGAIRGRMREVGRDEWDFDIVEYSIVAGDEQQYFWERWWIEKHKESHAGSKPPYNLVSGQEPPRSDAADPEQPPERDK